MLQLLVSVPGAEAAELAAVTLLSPGHPKHRTAQMAEVSVPAGPAQGECIPWHSTGMGR